MGVVTSKSKRESRGERKGRQPKAGKRSSSTSKNSMMMTALQDAEWNMIEGEAAGGPATNVKDESGTAERVDATRAWTVVEDFGEPEQNEAVLVVRQPSTLVTQSRTGCGGELKIYDVEPEAETTASGGRAEAATSGATGVVTDYNGDVTTAAADRRKSVTPLPLSSEVAAVKDKVRISTGGVVRAGILKEVSHGDGLPDVECVARGNDRKTSVVESALRCQTLRAAASAAASAAEVQGKSSIGNECSDGVGLASRSGGLCAYPVAYACTYGCSFPPSCPAPAGDFLHSLSAGKGGFMGGGAANGEHYACDPSSYGAKSYSLVMMASSSVGIQCRAAEQDSHPIPEQFVKRALEKDQGSWLVDDEDPEVRAEENKTEQKTKKKKKDMKAAAQANKLAEELITEPATEPSRKTSKYRKEDGVVAGARPAEQIAERQNPHSNPRPPGDATPSLDCEESEKPIWMEAAAADDDGGNGTEDSDETLTEEVAREDVADRPADLDDVDSWDRYDAALDCTPHHPSSALYFGSNRSSEDTEAAPRVHRVHENTAPEMEQYGKVLAGCQDNCDAVHVRGDAARDSVKVTGVRGNRIHSNAMAAALLENAMAASESAGRSTTGWPPEIPRAPSADSTVRDENQERCIIDAGLGRTATGSGFNDEAATWIDFEVTGNDSETAWSDAWITWSESKATEMDGEVGGGRGGGEGGGEGERGGREGGKERGFKVGTFFGKAAKSSRKLRSP